MFVASDLNRQLDMTTVRTICLQSSPKWRISQLLILQMARQTSQSLRNSSTCLGPNLERLAIEKSKVLSWAIFTNMKGIAISLYNLNINPKPFLLKIGETASTLAPPIKNFRSRSLKLGGPSRLRQMTLLSHKIARRTASKQVLNVVLSLYTKRFWTKS